jgi:hypothetical protein
VRDEARTYTNSSPADETAGTPAASEIAATRQPPTRQVGKDDTVSQQEISLQVPPNGLSNDPSHDPLDDAALFEAATAESETVPAEGDAARGSPSAGSADSHTPRDPRGRFASKAKDADAAPTQQPAETQNEPSDPSRDPASQAHQPEHPDAPIPSWRARELREQREAAERRASDIGRHYQALERQFHAMAAQLNALTPRPQAEPDLFADPDAFIRTKVEPVRQQVGAELGQMREGFSRLIASEKYGEDAVQAAYDELDRQMQAGGARYEFARIMASPHPFGELVKWHKAHQARLTVGDDPKAWFESELEQRLKDPAEQARMLERIRGAVSVPAHQAGGRAAPLVQLPPSLSRVPSAAPFGADDGDGSDLNLYRYATR